MKRFTMLFALALTAGILLLSLPSTALADTALSSLTLLRTLQPTLMVETQADVTSPPSTSSSWGRIKVMYRGDRDATGNQASEAETKMQNPGVGHYSSSRFPTDQCTWYAASEFDKVAPWPGCNWGGNAGTWVANASAAGWRTLAYPAYYPHAAGYMGIPAGSIIVWTGGSYGHVAVVRYVFQNGIYIQEKNWPLGSGVSPWRLLYWSQVMNRGSYAFSGYIPPWRR